MCAAVMPHARQDSLCNDSQSGSMSKSRRSFPPLSARTSFSALPESDLAASKALLSHRKLLFLRLSSIRHPSVLCAILIFSTLLLFLIASQLHANFCSLTFTRDRSSTSLSTLTATETVPEPTPFDLISTLEKWKDPQYSKRRLAIYVYDLPARFNEDLVRISHSSPSHIRDPYCDKNFYSSEVHVHRYLLSSSVRTMDPEQANFFYVPVYSTCDLINVQPNNLRRTGRNFRAAMHIVQNQYPYWNASNGRDHVFLFSQGFSARLAGDWTSIKNAIFMVHNGEFTALEYTPHKDFVIPPELRSYFQPIWRTKPESAIVMKRQYLGQFGGQVSFEILCLRLYDFGQFLPT